MTMRENITREGTPFIEIKISLEQPVELFDLVKQFGGIATQFRDHIAREHPDLAADATIYVKDLRAGSIILELVPYFMTLYQSMQMATTIDRFVNRVREIYELYADGKPVPDAKKGDLANYLDTIRAIAKDENGSLRMVSSEYHETKTTQRAVFEITTKDAQAAREAIERQQVELTLPAHEVVENELLVFWQSNKKNADTGKRTGEKAVIEKVSPRPLSVVYETDSARERIKYETTKGDRNLYKLGFYVDAYVERVNSKPVAFKITAVRDIIDLPDDEPTA